jgi:hypothetical protein
MGVCEKTSWKQETAAGRLKGGGSSEARGGATFMSRFDHNGAYSCTKQNPSARGFSPEPKIRREAVCLACEPDPQNGASLLAPGGLALIERSAHRRHRARARSAAILPALYISYRQALAVFRDPCIQFPSAIFTHPIDGRNLFLGTVNSNLTMC